MALDYGTGNGLTVQLAGPFGSVGSSAKIAQITLYAADWKNGESPFFQPVEIDGISASAMVQLHPDQEQIAKLCAAGSALYIENDGGSATAYAIGSKPAEDLLLQVTITEVISA